MEVLEKEYNTLSVHIEDFAVFQQTLLEISVRAADNAELDRLLYEYRSDRLKQGLMAFDHVCNEINGQPSLFDEQTWFSLIALSRHQSLASLVACLQAILKLHQRGSPHYVSPPTRHSIPLNQPPTPANTEPSDSESSTRRALPEVRLQVRRSERIARKRHINRVEKSSRYCKRKRQRI